MKDAAAIEAFIRSYLRERGATAPADADWRFFETGAIDSLGAMRFVSAIEEHFDIELHDDEIISENFRTLSGLTALIGDALARTPNRTAA